MIINHQYKFIYIKTYKTASTSIEAILTKLCSDDDIITECQVDLRTHRYRQAQNYRFEHPSVPKRPFWKTFLGRQEKYFHASVGYYEHMPAWRVKNYIGNTIWNSYFKFSFERNPWDRQVSFYKFKTRSMDSFRKPTFSQFLSNKKKSFIENWNLYTIDNKIALDFIGRYENLEEDFSLIKKSINAKVDLELPFINSSKERSLLYRNFYDQKSNKTIEDWYQREIEYFKYKF